jgi:hypothetical protein
MFLKKKNQNFFPIKERKLFFWIKYRNIFHKKRSETFFGKNSEIVFIWNRNFFSEKKSNIKIFFPRKIREFFPTKIINFRKKISAIFFREKLRNWFFLIPKNRIFLKSKKINCRPPVVRRWPPDWPTTLHHPFLLFIYLLNYIINLLNLKNWVFATIISIWKSIANQL